MTLFACQHDGKPVPQGRARVTRWGTFYPESSVVHREALAWSFREVHEGPPLPPPLAVSIGIAGARANSDLDNHAKMVLDALQDAGVIASDDVRSVVSLRLEVLPGEPRTFVSISHAKGVEATWATPTPVEALRSDYSAP